MACRRLRGSHTFDVLAAALEDVNTEFGISQKMDAWKGKGNGKRKPDKEYDSGKRVRTFHGMARRLTMVGPRWNWCNVL